jgi:hypothetical protein
MLLAMPSGGFPKPPVRQLGRTGRVRASLLIKHMRFLPFKTRRGSPAANLVPSQG